MVVQLQKQHAKAIYLLADPPVFVEPSRLALRQNTYDFWGLYEVCINIP